MSKIAALFVMPKGPYSGLADVDLWDEVRDARLYAGPHPVVAHPPCQRWGRYWFGGPSSKVRLVKGDDNGCFKSALESVRKWGGVLEHPEASYAWTHFGLVKPPKSGGWIKADAFGGWTCCVEQGHYGHKARKATWLYAVNTTLSELHWGPSANKVRLDEGFKTAAQRKAARAAGQAPIKRLSKNDNLRTPTAFRDLLITIAMSVYSNV
jgi:hypothetical protein